MHDCEDDDTQDGDTQTIADDQHGLRLDRALALLYPAHSRTWLKALIDAGEVMLDGAPCTQPSLKVAAGQCVSLHLPPPVDAVPQPEKIPLSVVYEDDDLLVIDKPAGLVVHPGAGHWTGTLVNALLHHCGDSLSGIGGVVRPGIVHRLDRDTTGLMVVAKNDAAHRGLSAQLADRSLSRTYQALVWGLPPAKGVVDKPIARSAANRQKMAIAMPGHGRDARTHYRTLRGFGTVLAWVECDLETGRTHQIRVHMASIRHPLVGDPVYGLQSTAQAAQMKKAGYSPSVAQTIATFPRQALHAVHLRFIHPATGVEMGFDSPLPEDLVGLLSLLNQ